MKIRLRKSYLLPATIIMASVAIGIWFEILWLNCVLATALFFLILSIVDYDSPIQMMYLLGFALFAYVPALINGIVLDVSFSLYYTMAGISIIFMVLTRGMHLKCLRGRIKRYDFALFLFFAVCVIVASFRGEFALYFIGPLVMFYAINLRQDRFVYNIALFMMFSGVFLVYFIVGWNGFGRTVTFSYLIVAALYLAYANSFKVNKLALCAIGALGSIGLVGRKEISYESNFEAILDDSAIGPYRLASSFVSHYIERAIDLLGFLDQVLFTILSFVPRDWWSAKPYGFGFQYVVENMEQSYVDAGHSIASTLIGDHLYFLGWWGLITGAAMIYFIALACRAANESTTFQGFISVIFAANMTVLVWGGMTSFSARIIFPLIGILPFVVISFLQSRFQRKRNLNVGRI